MKKIAILGMGILLSGSVLAATPNENTPHHKKTGDISYKQYMHQAKERFEKMDANHDKVLSAEERRAYWKKMRQHHAKQVKTKPAKVESKAPGSLPPVPEAD